MEKVHDTASGFLPDDYVKQRAEERLAEELRLLQEIVMLEDPQCAWQLLSKCAVKQF